MLSGSDWALQCIIAVYWCFLKTDVPLFRNLNLLLNWLLGCERAGVKLSEVYEAAISTVQDANPHLVEKLTKSAGFVSINCSF